MYYRLIFRHQSIVFQKLQEEFLLVDFNMLIRLCLNEALRILEPGHKSGLRQIAQGVDTVKLSIWLAAAKEPINGFPVRAILQVFFQLPRRLPAGDLLDRQVVPVVGDSFLHALVDSAAYLIHHRGDGLGRKRGLSVCENRCKAF